MKILGIGLGRTGTRSLYMALEILGYKTKHCPGFYLDDDGELVISPDDIRDYEALTAEQTIPIFKTVDQQYPGSKFILTIRDMESWFRSIVNNGNAMQEYRKGNPAIPVFHTLLYGSPVPDKELYVEAHLRHIASVEEYFRDRPRDMLVMNICAGDGWEKLCPFLGKEIPGTSFPKTNVFGVSDYATVMRKMNAEQQGQKAVG